METQSVSVSNEMPNGNTLLVVAGVSDKQVRREKGVPMLENIPYVNRLFKSMAIVEQPMWRVWLLTVKELPRE